MKALSLSGLTIWRPSHGRWQGSWPLIRGERTRHISSLHVPPNSFSPGGCPAM